MFSQYIKVHGWGRTWGSFTWGNRTLAFIIGDIITFPLLQVNGITITLERPNKDISIKQPFNIDSIKITSEPKMSVLSIKSTPRFRFDSISFTISIFLGVVSSTPKYDCKMIINTAREQL